MMRHNLTKDEVYRILYRFQLRPKRPGFFYTVQAILMISQMTNENGFTERDLYQKLASLYRVSEESVEYDLNAALRNAWRNHRELLSLIAGEQIAHIPSTLDFLRILASATFDDTCRTDAG